MVAPLTKLCSPVVLFVWTDECNHAFSAAKSLLYSAPVLAVSNLPLPFKVEAHASTTGAGAILLLDGDEDMVTSCAIFLLSSESTS